jgi:site-specific recombinase XerD
VYTVFKKGTYPMLATLSPQFDYSAIERADLQPSTRHQYRKALMRLREAGVNPFNADALAGYSNRLPHSSRAFLKSALALMARDYARIAQANATPENLPQIQAAIMRLEAMDAAIIVHTPTGTQAHIWLSCEQVENITAACDQSTLTGKRDWIVLGLLLGAGLRREELAKLTADALKQQPSKNGMRDVLEIHGKGDKTRVVPVSAALAQHLRDWLEIVGPGRIVRSINKAGTLGESLSAVAIHSIVRKYGAVIGIAELEPHDCRRTFARLGYDAGVPIEQISKLLGHANVKTTMLYLGLSVDLDQSVSDYIPLSGD